MFYCLDRGKKCSVMPSSCIFYIINSNIHNKKCHIKQLSFRSTRVVLLNSTFYLSWREIMFFSHRLCRLTNFFGCVVFGFYFLLEESFSQVKSVRQSSVSIHASCLRSAIFCLSCNPEVTSLSLKYFVRFFF